MKLEGWECPRCQRIWGPLALACLHCNDGVATVLQNAGVPVAKRESDNPLVRRAIVDLSAPGTPLRSRLNLAASDLADAGYSPGEIAARLEAGERIDV